MEPRDAFRCLRTIPRRRREALVTSLPPAVKREAERILRVRAVIRGGADGDSAARHDAYARGRVPRARSKLPDVCRERCSSSTPKTRSSGSRSTALIVAASGAMARLHPVKWQ
jgi:hypothetical protein